MRLSSCIFRSSPFDKQRHGEGQLVCNVNKWKQSSPVSIRKNRLYGFLFGRNIAQKRDFYSFRVMRYIFALFIFICSTSDTFAGWCDDVPGVIRSNNAELERLLARHESHTLDDAEACRFAHREFLPIFDKIVAQLYYYKSCNNLVAEKYATVLQIYKDLDAEYKLKCK